jgi:hypothetical protein
MVSVVGGNGLKGTGAFVGQGFHIAFERSEPGPYEAMRDEGVAVRGASVDAVVRTTTEIKNLIRDYIDAHFTGSRFTSNSRRRVSNTIQDVFYDDLEEKGQYAGLVYSKFGKRDQGRFVDYLLLHVRGGVLRPRSGDWLRIATPAGNILGAQSGFYERSGSDIFFRPSDDGKKLFQLRRRRDRGGRRGSLELLATLVKSVAFAGSLSGIEAIARRRPEMFEGYFAEALNLRRQASRS